MKNLANCAPTEFLTQAFKLRGPFAKWLEETGIPEIRKRRPDGYDGMKAKEKSEAMAEQAKENMGDMLAAALEKDQQGTLEVMALSCFTDPKDVDAHPMTEYLDAILEMLGSEAVRNFFMLYLKPTDKPSSKD